MIASQALGLITSGVNVPLAGFSDVFGSCGDGDVESINSWVIWISGLPREIQTASADEK